MINPNDYPAQIPEPEPVEAITIDRAPVESSNLKSVGYDEARQLLDVEFGSGGVFRYEAVPPKVHAELMAADSIGRCFHRLVRSKFKAVKLTA